MSKLDDIILAAEDTNHEKRLIKDLMLEIIGEDEAFKVSNVNKRLAKLRKTVEEL